MWDIIASIAEKVQAHILMNLKPFLADEFAYGSGNKFLTSVGGFMGDYNRAGFFATAFDAVIGWTNAGIVAFTKVHF